jgi:hypothetical protein
MNNETKDLILRVFEASLEAQLRAVRRLRQGCPAPADPRPHKGLSQVDMAFDILKTAHAPLHVSDILDRIQDSVRHHCRSREPGVLAHQKSGPRRPLPAPGKEHFFSQTGGRPVSLLATFLSIVEDWSKVFPQQRTFQRGVRQALGSLICMGRRCLTRIIWTNGGQNRSWSAEYFLHSRCQWEPQALFRPILKQALEHCPQRLAGVAIDDTRLRKTGRSIPQAFYQRDPLSPPFHVNLVLGLRFLQASLLVPLHRMAPVGTRALPIRFQEVSRVKRPGKRATEQMSNSIGKQPNRRICRAAL